MYRREEELKEKKDTNHEIIERSLLVAGILALAVAVPIAFLALGCGKQNETASTNAAQEPVAEQPGGHNTAGQIVVASTAGLTGGAENADGTQTTPEQAACISGAEAIAPDVAASVPDSVLAPGSVVEITAEGSPDVSDIVLTDRLGKKTTFTYDNARSLWRAPYRVPLKSREDLIGLSVTATNPAGLSKRVWVFIKFRDVANAETVQTETAN